MALILILDFFQILLLKIRPSSILVEQILQKIFLVVLNQNLGNIVMVHIFLDVEQYLFDLGINDHIRVTISGSPKFGDKVLSVMVEINQLVRQLQVLVNVPIPFLSPFRSGAPSLLGLASGLRAT